uniref:Zinc finger and BTB domain containing 4 n=1 Tax=Cyprinus carpio TaxID=7962 RepID=A0A8C2FHX4_CYPCA
MPAFPVDALEEEDHFVKVVDGHIIYFCSVCERSYMTLSSLKRHSNVHSWHRKYPCHYCDKVFALAEYRTKHEVWHTGERRYQCIFCWEAFPTYYNLKTHQKAFHGINPGLISSEKTANGGYKQKVNGLKLYRLLPMRSLKRPYKTYSQPMSGSNSGKSKIPNCPEGAVSSVIAFAHSKPSVIMHSAALSSSVIVHRNKMDSEERKRSPENHLMTKTGQKQMKKHSQREHTEAYREWDAVSVEALKMRQPSEKHHKGRKVHNKTESSKTIPLAVGSEVKGSGPLCQITVRIGEEAIVKRSISETDLRRDKSPTQQRHTNHHQRKHRNSSQERKEVESKWKTPKLKGKDNLWRPYYSYKPKRKALHMQGAKAWNRKLHYKRSLRPMRRAERLMKNLNKEIEVKDADEGEERRQKVKKERRECGTCGRWFSSSRKRDKHELTHLFEFNGSPVRLGRRPLIRYTCSQCDKVCKTSAALNCHLKRHELCSSTKVEDTQEKQDMPRCTPSAVETTPSKGLDTNCEQVQPVEGDNLPNEDFSDLQDAQDLRLFPQSSSRAQDLSMPTILAKKKELVQQIKHPSNISKEQSCNEEVSLLVPKEEPLSPIPSPTFSVIQTTPKGSSKRYSKSPCHSPGPL